MSLVDGMIAEQKLVVSKTEFREKMLQRGIEAFKVFRKNL